VNELRFSVPVHTLYIIASDEICRCQAIAAQTEMFFFSLVFFAALFLLTRLDVSTDKQDRERYDGWHAELYTIDFIELITNMGMLSQGAEVNFTTASFSLTGNFIICCSLVFENLYSPRMVDRYKRQTK